MITWDDYMMGRDITYAHDLTETIRINAQHTIAAANKLLDRFGEDRGVTSGWRPPMVNATTAGAAMTSKHMQALAIDIADPDGSLDEFLFIDGNVEAPFSVIADLRLWQEHPGATKGWCHVQIVPYGSWTPGKRRWFYP